jgi:hypothetical protein
MSWCEVAQVHLRRAARRQVEESMQPPKHQALTRGRQLHLLGGALQSAAEATEVDLVLQVLQASSSYSQREEGKRVTARGWFD